MAGNPNAKIRAANEGLTVIQNGAPNWTGEVRLIEDRLDAPLHWRKARRIFVNSLSDLFHESITFQDIEKVFRVMLSASQHQFQVLTKRAERLPEAVRTVMYRIYGPHWQMVPPFIWLGVSIEDVKSKARIVPLQETPAAVRWLSIEPLLEDIGTLDLRGIDWVVVGGESGPGARPCNVESIRSIVRQCRAAGVACHVKQTGAVLIGDPAEFPSAIHDEGDGHRTFHLGHPKGGDISEFPPDLRVREYPAA